VAQVFNLCSTPADAGASGNFSGRTLVNLLKEGGADPMEDSHNPDFSPFPLLPFSPFSPSFDALIVLGARLTPQGQPGRVARMRLRHGLHLWRRHGGQGPVILTGGFWPHAGLTEARAMAAWALAWMDRHGDPREQAALRACLILEEASRSTAASVRHTLPLVHELGGRVVGLVTDAVHMHRACFLFNRHFTPARVAVHPLAARGLVRHYWRERRYRGLARMALREGGAWLKVLGHLLRESKPPR
jgi:hypothetical protein